MNATLYKKSLATALLALSFLLMHLPVAAQNICSPRQTEAIRFGAVAKGEKECKRIIIANTLNEVIAIYAIDLRSESSEWSLRDVPQLPYKLEPGKEIVVVACYSPDGNTRESEAAVRTTYMCRSSEHRQYATTRMHGMLLVPTCVLRQTQTIKFPTSQSKDERNCERLRFTNTGNQVVVLHSVSVYEDNPNFTLTEVPDLPIRIQPGTTLTIGACYTPVGREGCVRGKIVGVYSCAGNLDDKRRSVTLVGGCWRTGGNAITPNGLLGSQSSQSFDESFSFTISPNPSRGNVTIKLRGAEGSRLAIYDMLGKEVFGADATEALHWLAPSSGVYIARLSGLDEFGEEFIVSKRLVIDK